MIKRRIGAVTRTGPLLVLPYPPTLNNLYATVIRKGKPIRIQTSAAKNYKATVALIARAAGYKKPEAGNLMLLLDIYRPRRSGDLSNTIKVIEDGLKGVAFFDDSQILYIIARRFEDKTRPRAEVQIIQTAGGIRRIESELKIDERIS